MLLRSSLEKSSNTNQQMMIPVSGYLKVLKQRLDIQATLSDIIT